jgi:large subunit ribosomal protein L3
MALGLVGRKCGMTRVFADDGTAVPVTVLDVGGNRVVQVRTPERDGYRAVQVTYGRKRPALLGKPLAGHYGKAGVEPGVGLWEFRLEGSEGDGLASGAELKADLFQVGQKVDVTGVTKGKGFAGTIKRHHFTMGDATHGNSLSHRAPGSIGQRQTPGRVFPGKKMAGHLGHARRTQPGLEVVQVDVDRGLLLVKGALPGPTGGDVLVRPAQRG